jgi:hypothetical protein
MNYDYPFFDELMHLKLNMHASTRKWLVYTYSGTLTPIHRFVLFNKITCSSSFIIRNATDVPIPSKIMLQLLG